MLTMVNNFQWFLF